MKPQDSETHAAKHQTSPSNKTPERASSTAGTAQSARDQDEKRRHPPSENALDSSQDKNPIPPGTVRK